jgi:hypothetical protein
MELAEIFLNRMAGDEEISSINREESESKNSKGKN